VREWDADTAAELRAWPLGGAADDVAVSADGARLAATGPAGTVWTIDLAAGTVGPIISLAGASGNGVAFAPRSPYLVASDGDGNVRFWHRETGQPIGRPMRFRGAVVRPRFRADADLFAVPGGGAVHLAGVPDPPGRLVTAGTGTRICGLDYAPAGDRLAVADERRLDLFDPATGSLIQTVPRTDDGPLAIRFDPDPARPTLYRGTRTGLDRIPVPAGRPEPARAFGPEAVTRVEAARRGGLFAATETRVTRFDRAEFKAVASGRPIPDPAAGVALGVLAVRPDGEEVLASFADRVVFLRADTLGFVRGWSVGDELLDARYTPDGTRVLVARRDNTAELLDAATGRPATARPLTHTRAVTAAAVSPDGTRLLTGSRDGTARFWDAATGLPLGPPLRHNGPVTHTAFAPPTGALVATGTGKGHVMVWAAPPPPAAESVSELRAKWGEGK
jgi:WD40 repeat protein